MDMAFDDVLHALQTIRCGAACTEEDLHALAAKAFEDAALSVIHEARLGPRCRIDFLAGDIGIEIKKKRPERAKLLAQIERYASCSQIAQIIVVAPKGVNLPGSIAGKRVTMMALERLWGIFLP